MKKKYFIIAGAILLTGGIVTPILLTRKGKSQEDGKSPTNQSALIAVKITETEAKGLIDPEGNITNNTSSNHVVIALKPGPTGSDAFNSASPGSLVNVVYTITPETGYTLDGSPIPLSGEITVQITKPFSQAIRSPVDAIVAQVPRNAVTNAYELTVNDNFTSINQDDLKDKFNLIGGDNPIRLPSVPSTLSLEYKNDTPTNYGSGQVAKVYIKIKNGGYEQIIEIETTPAANETGAQNALQDYVASLFGNDLTVTHPSVIQWQLPEKDINKTEWDAFVSGNSVTTAVTFPEDTFGTNIQYKHGLLVPGYSRGIQMFIKANGPGQAKELIISSN